MILVRLARILLLLVVIVVSANFLPKLYWMKFEKRQNAPFIVYSPVIEDFVIKRSTADVGDSELKWMDSKGNLYDRDDNDRLLPFFYYRQLAASNRLPDSIRGIPTPLDSIRKNGFTFRLRPSIINSNDIGLYSMLESQSGRVKLEMPDDFFSITGKMEFIDCASNNVNMEKSKLFTDALVDAGFDFPARYISGNPTTRKPFDEGYFVVDNSGSLFHIKMANGNPICINTNFPENIDIRYISVKESNLREFYAYVISEDNRVYLLSYNNYKPVELPVVGYNADTDVLFIIGDYFYRTISIAHNNNIEVFVTDRNYNKIDYYTQSWETNEDTFAGTVAAYLFPFTIEFDSPDTSWAGFYIRFSDFRAIPVMIISLFSLAILLLYKKQPVKKSLFDLLLVLVTGIYGLIAVFAVKNNI